MALANYDDLVKSIVNWSHRKDMLTLIPDFIKLAETEMYNNEGWQLETRDMETVSTAPTSGLYLELPPGFEKARSVQLETSNGLCDVKFQAPEQLMRQPTTGQPRFFSVVGNEIEFDRTPDSEYTIQIQYYKKPDPLTEVNQTNSVMTNHPNIYLFGALHQVFVYLEDQEQMVKYFSKMQSVIRGANKSAKKARYGAAPYMRVEGVSP
tara:strand:- start:1992 stop:2615 length:624 start_codon:yes stop_codon:yes gene_type:complete